MFGLAVGEHFLTCVHWGVGVLMRPPWRCFLPLRLCPCNTSESRLAILCKHAGHCAVWCRRVSHLRPISPSFGCLYSSHPHSLVKRLSDCNMQLRASVWHTVKWRNTCGNILHCDTSAYQMMHVCLHGMSTCASLGLHTLVTQTWLSCACCGLPARVWLLQTMPPV